MAREWTASLAAMLTATAFAVPVGAQTQALEANPEVFAILKKRADRIRSLGNTPIPRQDQYRELPDAISLKNKMLGDGIVDTAEKALLRAIVSSEPTLAVRSGGQTLEVMNLRYASARSVLLSLFSDFDCATSYWLHGAFNAAEHQGALQRANFALDKHLQADSSQSRAAVEQQLMTEGQARGQRIQQGHESADGLRANLTACESKYGFARAGAQQLKSNPAKRSGTP